MSQHIRQLAIAAFRATAEEAYQTGSKLRHTVTEATGVEAETYRFPVFGTTDATVRASQSDVVPSNLTNKKPTATLSPRESFDYLDRQDQALTNVDTMRAYGMIHGKAVSRQFDADIIAALSHGRVASSNTPGYDTDAYSRDDLGSGLVVVTGSTGTPSRTRVTADVIAEARSILMDEMDDDDSTDICLLYPGSQFRNMADELKLASMDYMQGTGAPGVTKTGRFEQIYGCKPIFIGQNARRSGHGKLPDNVAYMYHKRAVGLAVGTTERLGIVAFIEQKRSWLMGAEANAGAVRINNGGIVEIQIRA